jgi:hypothetical protein
MQPKTGQIHVLRLRASVQLSQNPGDLVDMFRIETAPLVMHEKSAQPAMPKSPDHHQRLY